MTQDVRLVTMGFVLLLPALVLVSTGLLDLERPAAIVHPVLVMGGLALSFALNLLPIFDLRLGYQEGALVGTMSFRVRGSFLNLAVLGLGGVLLTVIALYLFVENFQPR